MGSIGVGLLGLVYHPLGRVALTRVGVGGGGNPGSLSVRIGEHTYYCWGKGICPVTRALGLGTQVNLDTVILTLVTMAIIILLALFARTRLTTERPRPLQNVLEVTFEFVNDFVTDTLGAERTKGIGPLAVALFLFILISNWFDLLPIPRVDSPTTDINTTAGLAVMTFVLVQILGVRQHGVVGYIKHLFSFPALAPLTVLEELSKPLTLAFRLFGNIFAGEVLIIVFGVLLSGILYVVLPIGYVFAIGLGLFIGLIQAFIFSVLMVSYVGIATSREGH